MNDYFLNEIDLDGFQVVKSQYFQKQAEPVLTLWATSMAFGQGAYQALNSCESIQLMIIPIIILKIIRRKQSWQK